MSDAGTFGTVMEGRNNIFTVRSERGVLLCRLKGKRLNVDERNYSPLAAGDEVVVTTIDEIQGTGIIMDRRPRRNAFERYNAKRNAPQALAANVDLALCVTSTRNPAFRARFVDRFLVLCEEHGIPGGIVLNKIDLDPSAARLTEAYLDAGYSVHVTSAVQSTGLAELHQVLRGKRTTLIGQSGVGKSELINALAGETVQRTGAISARYLIGRHTTTAGRLITVDDTEIIDTPGVRELDARLIHPGHLDWCYPEFRDVLGQCEHVGCTHVQEAGCAVEAAAATGTIRSERYESYCRLYLELAGLEMESR